MTTEAKRDRIELSEDEIIVEYAEQKSPQGVDPDSNDFPDGDDVVS